MIASDNYYNLNKKRKKMDRPIMQHEGLDRDHVFVVCCLKKNMFSSQEVGYAPNITPCHP